MRDSCIRGWDVTLDEWGQHWAGEGSPRNQGWLPLRGGFCPEINSLAGELQPLSGILMLASVAEHASSPPGMRAKSRRKRSTRDFFDILDLLTGRRFVMVPGTRDTGSGRCRGY